MSITYDSNPSSSQSCSKGLCANPSASCIEKTSRSLTIGLVNNMPDSALEATERQFLSLLDAASEGYSVRLTLYSLPGITRNEWGTRHVKDFYSSVDELKSGDLDGLIVTGREPLTPNLADEPYWESFTKLVDWARENTYAAAWSCLAAHAAVLYLDGIGRARNGQKFSGIFECEKLAEHPLTAGTPSQFNLPHSRWNGLSADQLTASGYRVLTRAAANNAHAGGDAGVDTFVKQDKSLFVFFQGHPEYEPNTLLLEYRRDIGRYLRGESETYPIMPHGYFGEETAATLTAIEEKAVSARNAALLAEVQETLESATVENTWRQTAACIYRNWLQYISAQKKAQLQRVKAAREEHDAAPAMRLVATVSEAPRPSAYSTGVGPARPRLIRAVR
jgi:homoserine O-succinyltransferase/O-acetyltransferase